MNDLKGKTALVTGGAGGIDSMMCEALLQSGCRLLVQDLPKSDGAAKARTFCDRFGAGRAIFAPGDLADLPILRRESEALVAAEGGFDFLVNNTAIDPVAPIEAYSLEEFLAVQTEDLVGAAVFLSSPASLFVTAMTTPVDGGYVVSGF